MTWGRSGWKVDGSDVGEEVADGAQVEAVEATSLTNLCSGSLTPPPATVKILVNGQPRPADGMFVGFLSTVFLAGVAADLEQRLQSPNGAPNTALTLLLVLPVGEAGNAEELPYQSHESYPTILHYTDTRNVKLL